MRTKLFLAFVGVILIALVSNFIYERLMIRDFEDYTLGVQQDRLYWVLASVEGSYTGQAWDAHLLSHPMQWGTMLGYDLVVLDNDGEHVTSSLEALSEITPAMLRRIESLVHVDTPVGDYEEYPLYSEGREIGYLMVRPLEARRELDIKEQMFKRRGRDFLLISFVIAGGSAAALSVLMSLLLTRPLRRLKAAADRVAAADLEVRVAKGPRDEVGTLIESFNSMVESLQREDTLRKHLTSNIAHELRTPLAVLRSHMEAVSDGVVPCTPESVRALEGEVARLTSLVKGIEDFTRAEASLLAPTHSEPIVLLEFTRSIAHGMEKIFAARSLRLTVSGDEGIEVMTDAPKIETVLRNILANAAAHVDTGGVDLRSGTLDDGRAGGFYIEVLDTGSGIPEGDEENIFKRFYKGKGSEGTGLGLAIARELVEALGGTIGATNRPDGKGAAFRVEIPSRRPA